MSDNQVLYVFESQLQGLWREQTECGVEWRRQEYWSVQSNLVDWVILANSVHFASINLTGIY